MLSAVATPKPNAPVVLEKAGCADPQGEFSASSREVLRRSWNATEDAVFDQIRNVGFRDYPVRRQMASHTQDGTTRCDEIRGYVPSGDAGQPGTSQPFL
jgi:hypothetical protein